jgi:hypothetical protein
MYGAGFCGFQTCTVWFGDHFQLGPVSGTPLTCRPKATLKAGHQQGINHWRTNVQKVVLLKQVHRQSSSTQQRLLDGIRLGTTTSSQHSFWISRVVGSPSVPKLKPYRDALFLFGTNDVVAEFNRLLQEQMSRQDALLSNSDPAFYLQHSLAIDSWVQSFMPPLTARELKSSRD